MRRPCRLCGGRRKIQSTDTCGINPDRRMFGLIHRTMTFCSATVMKLSVLNKALKKVLRAVDKQGRALILKGFNGVAYHRWNALPSPLHRMCITVALYSRKTITLAPHGRSPLHYMPAATRWQQGRAGRQGGYGRGKPSPLHRNTSPLHRTTSPLSYIQTPITMGNFTEPAQEPHQ